MIQAHVSASHRITLELVSGGHASLELEPPGADPSSYFGFLRGAGAPSIWPLVRNLLQMGRQRQPICNYVNELRKIGVSEADVTVASLRELLSREGYAFGIVGKLASLPVELDEMGRKTFMFVRDPRASVAELAAGTEPVPIGEFVQSPQVVGVYRECRRLADFCRKRRHVRIVRLEDLSGDPTKLAGALAEMLGLSISSAAVLRVAASTPGRVEPRSSYLERFDRAGRVVLDETFADVLAFFGYLPEEAPSPVFLEHWSEFQRAMLERLSANGVRRVSVNLATRPTSQVRAPTTEIRHRLVENDPELLWRLKRNGKDEKIVLGRRVTMEVDNYGCRPVLGQPTSGEKTLAAYGCSFTYGMAIPYEETFCSVLQSMLPRWRVENYGTSGYSTAQNLIQLRRNSRWSTPDYVTFCFIPGHRWRNVGEISIMRSIMAGPYQGLLPRAALAPDGSLAFRYVKHPRWDLDGLDLSDFKNDDYYVDLVTASLFERAFEIVKQSGSHFFATTLSGGFSPGLSRRLSDAGIPVLNASVQGKEFTCLPDDGHPNARANRVYAERIRDYVMAREAGMATEPAVVTPSAVKPTSP